MSETTMTVPRPVVIRPFGSDFHGEGCECGRCSLTGKAYGVAVYDAEDVRFYDGKYYLCSAFHVAYAPTEWAACHNARMAAEKNGMRVLNDEEFEKFCESRPVRPDTPLIVDDEDFIPF